MRETRDSDLEDFKKLRARYEEACGEEFYLWRAPQSFLQARVATSSACEYGPGPAWEVLNLVLERCIKNKTQFCKKDHDEMEASSRQFCKPGVHYG